MATPPLRRPVVSVANIIGATALILSIISFAQPASAKTVPGDLRVVDPTGATLADQTQYTTAARIKTDPGAKCFIGGIGGSGEPASLPGNTAFGQLVHAAKLTRSLRPLSVTDEFSFGLGICGIGKAIAPSTGWWYVKVNHVDATAGADQITVKKGDSVLWYLIEDFMLPAPDELALKVAKKPKDGRLAVRVFSYAGNGSRTPAQGVDVRGAAEPTDASGKTEVEIGPGVTKIQATAEGFIPSEVVKVCGSAPKDCPPGFARTIGGTTKPDVIKASSAATTIRAGGGRDKVRVPRGKLGVVVNCGPGKDVLRIAKSRKAKLKSCEKVRRFG